MSTVVNELSKEEVEEIKVGIDQLVDKLLRLGMTPYEYFVSIGQMVPESPEEREARIAGSVPIQ